MATSLPPIAETSRHNGCHFRMRRADHFTGCLPAGKDGISTYESDGYCGNRNVRIAVIGGGPAGFFGAISAAEHNPGAEIVIFEATHKPLDKVRISGGGRCNVTHNCTDPALLVRNYPRGYKELIGPFNRFQPKDTIAWFTRHGVQLKAEADGRMFPVTDDSATIVNCLLRAAHDRGIKPRLAARIKHIRQKNDQKPSPVFSVTLMDASANDFERVLLATGNSPQGYRLAEALGHTIVPPVPSLYTFKIDDARLRGLSGISFDDVHLALCDKGAALLEQRGPILITHWGLSGPAVLKLSAWGARLLHERHYHAELLINFVPNLSRGEVERLLREQKERHGRRRVAGDSPFGLPKSYWSRMVNAAGISDPLIWSYLTKEQLVALCRELTEARFAIAGKGIFKEEFVTCGGVALDEIDFRTMQSKRCSGAYFAGEVLDIDGITGGFNFQSAWTTGWIAGESMSA